MNGDFQAWYSVNPLRAWRSKHHLSMNQAASSLGVGVKSVQLWEQGATTPQQHNFDKIQRVTGISDLDSKWTKWRKMQPDV